ncbi:MAG: coproporphyrinogen dehydrogenase HemZ [Oscillospiraceae bacterium]|nr:coproporphyrinogen dehydrogenase HemZ [Oscillospiraceae bacterium]
MPGRAPAWGWLTGIRPAKLMTALLNGGLDGEEAQEEMRRLYGVSPERAELCLAVAKAGLRVKLGPEDTAIYIGVPFCPTRCAYCSFVSAAAGRSGKYMEPFVSALEYELEQTAQTIKTLGLRVKAVYIGGGTPTALPLELFKRMLGAVGRHIPFGDVEEYTIEAGRADTITPENTAVMREYGADRISVNPQSMNEKTLELIGRRHGVGEVYRAFELTKGFGAVNMDVIAGLPGENAGDFEQTLSSVIALQPENITVHTLSRKRGSDMSGDSAPPEEHVSEMIEHSLKALPRAGYGPYYLYRQKFMAGDFENIGWSADGHDCLYNIIMMEEKVSVLALGGGGVTRLVHPDTRFIDRAYNQKYASEYNNSQAKIDKKQQFVISFYQSDGTQRKRGFYWP